MPGWLELTLTALGVRLDPAEARRWLDAMLWIDGYAMRAVERAAERRAAARARETEGRGR